MNGTPNGIWNHALFRAMGLTLGLFLLLAGARKAQADDDLNWHGVNKGVLVGQIEGPVLDDAHNRKWHVTFGVSSDVRGQPKDPEAEDNSTFKHMRFICSQIANSNTQGDRGNILSIDVTAVNGAVWHVVQPDGPFPRSTNLTDNANAVLYSATWSDAATVQVKQATDFEQKRAWQLVRITIFSQFPDDGIKRYECRAGLDSAEPVTLAANPANPIIRVDTIKPDHHEDPKSIWGAISVTSGPQLAVAVAYRANGDVLADGSIFSAHPIAPNSFVRVEQDSALPELEAAVLPATNVDVNWKFRVDFSRHYMGDSSTVLYENHDMYPANGGYVTLNDVARWRISEGNGSATGGNVRGGTAQVTLHKAIGGGEFADSVFTFYIRGTNPPASQEKAYATSQHMPWYDWGIALHESHGGHQFNPGDDLAAKVDTPKGGQGCPNQSPDGGAGIMQLTIPAATSQQLWSWKANFDQGAAVAADKRAIANGKMNDFKAKTAIPIPSQTIGGVTFSDASPLPAGAVPMLDAYTIKLYNKMNSWRGGAYVGSHYFAEWDGTAWQIYPENAGYWKDKGAAEKTWHPIPYVENVCRAYMGNPY